ncbi:sigma-70 family RNA polymerase sigma factor [Aquihabitans sp. G128]|uniref:sigma-70 family RNA polymerase sigma factor n=1 Tax=Aquihabitans sp. G128 TaxID=2849779 RepID=UPI001C23ECBD|nr:sigma-70 family RNA polymerase sigma factor [Aquihabitans sp. G128]QXC59970.1 sigma-70 family RNA polymerase sigma factor [Aquihabitans sp. G128]
MGRAARVGAVGACFEERRGDLLRYARSRVGPAAAEDVVAEAVAATLAAIDRGAGPRERVDRYLFVAVKHGCHVAIRRRVRERELLAAQRAAARIGADADGHPTSSAEVLELLEGRQQQVLALRALEGWSRDEVADHLGISPDAVSAITYRARTRLRSLGVAS